MDLEETKKMIESEIEAQALTKNVRSQIKTYIHEKQNVREGFKETFKPLIESQDKVKESIDKEQNELIKQLQEKQLALSQGLDKNRLAITQGFDKMDEVKKWDLQQLPGYEAIEEPEEYEEEYRQEEPEEYEEPEYLISSNDTLKMQGREDWMDESGEKLIKIGKSDLDNILSKGKFNEDNYSLRFIDREGRILKVVEKNYGKESKKGVVTFTDTDLDKGLLYKHADKILKNLKLPLPSEIKNEKYKVIKNCQKNAEIHLDYFGKLLSKKADLYTEKGINKAIPKSKEPREDTKRQIDYYNVLGVYVNNISKLENYAEKKQDKVFYISTTLFNFSTDLNYSLVLFLLEIMEYCKSFLKLLIFFTK